MSKTIAEIALELAHGRDQCGYDHEYSLKGEYTCCADADKAQAKLIEAALAEARREALEEAAKIADETDRKAGEAYEYAYDQEAARLYGAGSAAHAIADAIRSLAAKDGK